MANFFVSYDLNGPNPSHREMDEHLSKIATRRARVLETVWWLEFSGSAKELCDKIKTILGKEDLLLVVEAKDAAWTRLLVDTTTLQQAWRNAA